CVEGDSEDRDWTHQFCEVSAESRATARITPDPCPLEPSRPVLTAAGASRGPGAQSGLHAAAAGIRLPGHSGLKLDPHKDQPYPLEEMAEQPKQQQMKTSFLLIKLQAPPARGLPSRSPAAPAWTAAPGGLEEGRVFPSPRTGFLAGPDLGRTQHLAAPPPCLLKGRCGTQTAAFSRPAAQDTDGGENPWAVHVRSGGTCRPSLAPAHRKLAGLQPLPRGLPSPAPVMSDWASCKLWPLLAAPQGLRGTDPQSWDALGCSMPWATQAHANDCGDRAVLLGGGVTCHVPPESCGENTGTTAWPMRAQLSRCHPPIQTSKSSPALPAALPLKTWLLPLRSATFPATRSLLFGRRV
ncbi:hypothetical protein MC885_011260, partial [Smutsia gigantea]